MSQRSRHVLGLKGKYELWFEFLRLLKTDMKGEYDLNDEAYKRWGKVGTFKSFEAWWQKIGKTLQTSKVQIVTKIEGLPSDEKKIYIEVPCFDWIGHHRAWFDIFYEHVNYFRLNDFKRMFGIILEGGHVFGGQYLYVVADLTTLRVPKYADDCRADLPPDFLDNVRHHAEVLKTRRTGRSAIWGGASKGVIFALFMQRAGVPVDIGIDINPAKQGKYLAGSGLRIHSPEEAMALLIPDADVFVMNRNYLSEIIERSGNQYNYLEIDREII